MNRIFLIIFISIFYIHIVKAELPPLPQIEKNNLSVLAKIKIKHIEFINNTIFSDAELKQFTNPYIGHEISMDELQKLKRKISNYYIKNGYVNSGAIIPDQKVENGIIKINIIEGKLSQIELGKLEGIKPSYITKRIINSTVSNKQILNIHKLQEQLKLLEQKPFIKRINAELSPGAELGQSILRANIEPTLHQYHLDFKFNNYRSPSIGSYQGEFLFTHENLTGWGDNFSLGFSKTQGLNFYNISYSIPINSNDTTLFIKANNSDVDIIEQPFKKLNIESKANSYTIGLYHPIFKTIAQEFALGLSLNKRHSESTILGIPYDFSLNKEIPGGSDISVLAFSQDYIKRSQKQVLAMHSEFRVGLDILDATIRENSADGRFVSWVGQFQLIQRLKFLESQLLFKTNMQLSNDSLLSQEQFSIGGHASVRGYRENHLIRDNAITASLEWQIPITNKLKIPKFSKLPTDGVLNLTPFIDYGYGRDDKNTPKPTDISSIGLSLNWIINKNIQAEFYWAKALRNIKITGEDNLQDDGIGFQLSLRVF
jgi:hemolysin activation/secretion protein